MMSRRNLLQVLTLGAAGAALNPQGRRAYADPDQPPRRLVLVYTPEGLHYAAADRASQWAQVAAPNAFTPVGMAAPLARHKGNMVLLQNVAIVSANPTYDGQNGQRGGVETHIGAKAMVSTNQDVSDFTNFLCQTPKGESLDIFLGRKIGQIATPAWPSLQLGIATDNSVSGTMSFLADGSPVLSSRDPYKVYQGLFGAGEGSARLVRRKSVLDLVARDMPRFLRLLPADAKARAEAQVDAIRTLEARLSASLSPSCDVPKPPATAALNLDDGHSAPMQAGAMMDLIGAAFACDQTRVVSLVFQGVYGSVAGGLLGGTADNLHGMSHYSDPGPMIAAKRAMFESIASLADRLAAIPEGDGSVLDNTLIVHVTEETDNHTLTNLPFFTLGGRNLGVRVGNVLALPTIATSTNGASSGFPVGGVWQSVIQAMGLPAQPFGNPIWSSQSMPNFLAT